MDIRAILNELYSLPKHGKTFAVCYQLIAPDKSHYEGSADLGYSRFRSFLGSSSYGVREIDSKKKEYPNLWDWEYQILETYSQDDFNLNPCILSEREQYFISYYKDEKQLNSERSTTHKLCSNASDNINSYDFLNRLVDFTKTINNNNGLYNVSLIMIYLILSGEKYSKISRLLTVSKLRDILNKYHIPLTINVLDKNYNYIAKSKKNQFYSQQRVNQLIKEVCKKIGFPPLSTLDLRKLHTSYNDKWIISYSNSILSEQLINRDKNEITNNKDIVEAIKNMDLNYSSKINLLVNLVDTLNISDKIKIMEVKNGILPSTL